MAYSPSSHGVAFSGPEQNDTPPTQSPHVERQIALIRERQVQQNDTLQRPDTLAAEQKRVEFQQQFGKQLDEQRQSRASSPQNVTLPAPIAVSQSQNVTFLSSHAPPSPEQRRAEFLRQFNQQLQKRAPGVANATPSPPLSLYSSKSVTLASSSASTSPRSVTQSPPTSQSSPGRVTKSPPRAPISPKNDTKSRRQAQISRRFQADILATFDDEDYMDKATLKFKVWPTVAFEHREPEAYVEFDMEERYLKMGFETVSCLGIL